MFFFWSTALGESLLSTVFIVTRVFLIVDCSISISVFRAGENKFLARRDRGEFNDG